MTRVLLALFVLWPATADAHLVTTGLGPVYDGVSHVLVSPDDLLPVVMIGLLAGLNGAAAGRSALFLLPLAWLLAGCAGLLVGHAAMPDGAAAATFLVLGGLTALDRRLSPQTVAVVGVLVGLLHGWRNGAAIAASQREGLGLLGISATVFVLVALSAAPAASVRVPWARIAFRVAGSWVAAIGLLMAGWSLRSGAH